MSTGMITSTSFTEIQQAEAIKLEQFDRFTIPKGNLYEHSIKMNKSRALRRIEEAVSDL